MSGRLLYIYVYGILRFVSKGLYLGMRRCDISFREYLQARLTINATQRSYVSSRLSSFLNLFYC